MPIIKDKKSNIIGILIPFMLSSYALFSISMVLKKLSSIFNVPLSIISLTFPIDFIGGAIGGLILGRFADRIGRRSITIISTIMFSVSTLLASFSRSIIEIFILWFFVGVGVNAENGIAYALIIETLGSYTGSFGGLVQGLYFVGFGLDALTYRFLPYWRSLFLVVGTISLIVGFISSYIIKETLSVSKKFKSDPMKLLFDKNYVKKTILFSLIVIGAFLLSVPLLSIGPSFVESIGLGSMTGILSLIGFISFWIAGYLSDKIGRAITAIIFSIIGLIAGSLLCILFNRIELTLVILLISLIFIASGLFSYDGIWVSEAYPTSLRATASNFVFLFGRLIGGFSPEIVALISNGNLAYGIGIISALSSFIILISSMIFKLTIN
ncbi:MAG: MFS transporter [Caldisphaera sp.]|jgi:MFS family permease|nr:MFS transporter [Caldisphaera sp.]PMP59505.1 MAG: MFS transporter [Caldisphaera sp.]